MSEPGSRRSRRPPRQGVRTRPPWYRSIPLWLAFGVVLAVPTHIVAWSWFSLSGLDLIWTTAPSLIAEPQWLTSVLYFPIGLLLLGATEFMAVLPLNFVLVVFGIRQHYALRDRKHFVHHKGGRVAHQP